MGQKRPPSPETFWLVHPGNSSALTSVCQRVSRAQHGRTISAATSSSSGATYRLASHGSSPSEVKEVSQRKPRANTGVNTDHSLARSSGGFCGVKS